VEKEVWLKVDRSIHILMDEKRALQSGEFLRELRRQRFYWERFSASKYSSLMVYVCINSITIKHFFLKLFKVRRV